MFVTNKPRSGRHIWSPFPSWVFRPLQPVSPLARMPVRLSDFGLTPISEVTNATFVVDKDGIAASPEVYDYYTHPDLDGWYKREDYSHYELSMNEFYREQQAALAKHSFDQMGHYAHCAYHLSHLFSG